jgi:hypothetical protein
MTTHKDYDNEIHALQTSQDLLAKQVFANNEDSKEDIKKLHEKMDVLLGKIEPVYAIYTSGDTIARVAVRVAKFFLWVAGFVIAVGGA